MVTARRSAIVAAAVFAVTNITSLVLAGIRYGGDTNMYIDAANDILAGRPVGARATTYPVFCFLLAAIHGLGLRFEWIVAVQLVAALLALAAAVQLGEAIGAAGRACSLACSLPSIPSWRSGMRIC